MVEEADGCLLIVVRVDAQHPQPGAVVDRGVLVVTALRPVCPSCSMNFASTRS